MMKRNGGTFCRRSADREKPEECLEDNVREGEEALSGVGAKLFRCRNRGTGIFGDGREIGAAEKATILGKKPKKKALLTGSATGKSAGTAKGTTDDRCR